RPARRRLADRGDRGGPGAGGRRRGAGWGGRDRRRARGAGHPGLRGGGGAGAAIGVASGLVALHGAGQVDPYWTVAIEHLTTAVSSGAIAVAVVRRDRRGTARLLPTRDRWRALTVIALTG